MPDANYFDQFDQPAQPQGGTNYFDQFDQPGTIVMPPATPGVLSQEQAEDIIKSAGTGLGKGAAMLAGIPGDLRQGVDTALGAIEKQSGGAGKPTPDLPLQPTSKTIEEKAQEVTGPWHQPSTQLGRYAENVGEFTPAALAGATGEGIIPSAVKYALAPGVASEAAGEGVQAIGGSPGLEGAARFTAAALSPFAAGRAMTPFNIPQQNRDAAALLANEGVNTTAGQQIGGNNWVKYLETDLRPGRNDEQLRAFTRAALNRAGVDADEATIGPNGVIDQMLQNREQRYNALTNANTFQADPQLVQDIGRIHNEYVGPPGRSVYSPGVTQTVQGALGRVYDALQNPGPGGVSGTMSGADYQRMRSNIQQSARGAADPQQARALNEVVDMLDDGMERSIQANNPQDAGQFGQLRRDYKNALVIERARGKQGADVAANYILPHNLQESAKTIYGKRAYLRGQDDFSDLAEAGANILAKAPDSGTPFRQRINDFIGALTKGAGMVAGGHEMGTEGAVAGYLAGEGLAPITEGLVRKGVIQPAIMNPVTQRYLTNNAAPGYVPNNTPRLPLNQSPGQIATTAEALRKALPPPQ